MIQLILTKHLQFVFLCTLIFWSFAVMFACPPPTISSALASLTSIDLPKLRLSSNESDESVLAQWADTPAGSFYRVERPGRPSALLVPPRWSGSANFWANMA